MDDTSNAGASAGKSLLEMTPQEQRAAALAALVNRPGDGPPAVPAIPASALAKPAGDAAPADAK